MVLKVHRELANKLCVQDVMHEFIVRNEMTFARTPLGYRNRTNKKAVLSQR